MSKVHRDTKNAVVSKASECLAGGAGGGDCDSHAAAALFPEAAPPGNARLLDLSLEKGDPGPAGQCSVSAAAAEPAAIAPVALVVAAAGGPFAASDQLSSAGRRGECHPHRSF